MSVSFQPTLDGEQNIVADNVTSDTITLGTIGDLQTYLNNIETTPGATGQSVSFTSLQNQITQLVPSATPYSTDTIVTSNNTQTHTLSIGINRGRNCYVTASATNTLSAGSSASVTNSVTTDADGDFTNSLTFDIPRGQQGQQGQQGERGEKGDRGDKGDTGAAGDSTAATAAAVSAGTASASAAVSAGTASASAAASSASASAAASSAAAAESAVSGLSTRVGILEDEVDTLNTKTLYLNQEGTITSIDGTGGLSVTNELSAGSISTLSNLSFTSESVNIATDLVNTDINIGSGVSLINLNGIVTSPYDFTSTGFFSQFA